MQDSQEVQLAWVNMLFGRVFWDVWQDRYWADKIKQRFQNKLSRVHKPQFIRDIHITDLSLGHTFPLINKVSPPVLDEQGMWVDFDVTYSGGIVFTVETHLNIDGYLNYFLNLGKEKELLGDLDMAELSRKYDIIEKDELMDDENHPPVDGDNQSLTSESPPESDSDFESPESDLEELTNKLKNSRPNSYDDDSPSPSEVSSENLYAQEALMQLKSLEGFLEKQIAEAEEMNLYGFRDDPLLFVTARPKLGARQVKLTHVTDWIEKKLKQEFKNMFVLPNMEDISIKIMNSDVEKQFADN
ncbi:hypothetical protein QZH41_018449 [Actinostola sp. cb2023]|nr:hypothetical protein QZH41_018449 [Actinostola sp. cb2023]